MWVEHAVDCSLCDWRESWDSELAMKRASVHHIYEEHRAEWIERVGDHPPLDVRPEVFGRKLEDWESQA